MKRKVIFVFYDKSGIVDNYLLYLLQCVRTEIGPIIFVANGLLNEESYACVQALAEQVIVRPNEGLDAWGYKAGIDALDVKERKSLDALVLMNDTCFGPIFPFNEAFSRMESRKDIDFWGMTSSVIGIDIVRTEKRLCGRHIDTYFMVFHRRILRSRFFGEYWKNLPHIHNYEEAVKLNEQKITEFFAKNGFHWASAFQVKSGRDHVFFAPYRLISVQHCPLLKRRAFTNPEYVDYFCHGRLSDIPKTLRYIEHHSEYPVAYLWQHILRFSNYQTILCNLSLSQENNILSISSEDMDMALLIPYRWKLSLHEYAYVLAFFLRKIIRKIGRFLLYPFFFKYFRKMKP
ncbi:MAG: rhamnan synthesis F family protein [Spirochaetia bacterium]